MLSCQRALNQPWAGSAGVRSFKDFNLSCQELTKNEKESEVVSHFRNVNLEQWTSKNSRVLFVMMVPHRI